MSSLSRWITWIVGLVAKHRLAALGTVFSFFVGLAQLSGFSLRDLLKYWHPPAAVLDDKARSAIRGQLRAFAADGLLSVHESRSLRDYVADLKLEVEEAEKYLRQIEPEMVQAARDLQEGLALTAKDRYSEARARFREATRLDAESATAWSNLGGTELELGAIAEAEAAFRVALSLEPDNIEANYNLAACLAAQNRTIAALEYLERSMALLLRAGGQPSFEKQALLSDLESSVYFSSLRATPRFVALVQRVHDDVP